MLLMTDSCVTEGIKKNLCFVLKTYKLCFVKLLFHFYETSLSVGAWAYIQVSQNRRMESKNNYFGYDLLCENIAFTILVLLPTGLTVTLYTYLQ